jgi:type II secretory pathway pseudopilin PulG
MSVAPVSPPPEPTGGPPGEKKSSGIPWWVWLIIAGSCCFLAVPVIAVVAAIAIPNLIEARKGSSEAAAIGALRTITTAQALFREGDKDENQVLDYAGDLATLDRHIGLDQKQELRTGTKQGYIFRIERATELEWEATATPLKPGVTGDRSFFVDESGVIRFRPAERGKAGRDDSAIGG